MTDERINLYVDDVRDPPSGWVVARTQNLAVNLLMTGTVQALSLDFDLGAEGTIEPVLAWMENAARKGWTPPRTMMAHSQNPVGRNLINLRLNDILLYASDPDLLDDEVDTGE